MQVSQQPDNLNARDREHYAVARTLPGWFTAREFRDCYRSMYPDRKPGSIIPSDYCVNRDNKGNATYPRFLKWDNGSRYRFIDFERTSPVATGSPPAQKAAGRDQRHPRRPRHLGRIFTPMAGSPLLLDPKLAEEAIREYNGDRKVLSQEDHVFIKLSSGLSCGQVFSQLKAVNAAYRTRSATDDLAKIANAIETNWGEWERLLRGLAPLAEQVPPFETTKGLMRYFLSTGTKRLPRSLATKTLHFVQPLTFIPADSYAVDQLGRELSAGEWSNTSGLDAEGMARWYSSYLQVIHDIGAANPELVQGLLELDQETGDRPAFNRVRGLPKVVDKIGWWAGRQAKEGQPVKVFQ